MLDQSQIDFIQEKVRQLGSVEAVKEFYKEKNGKLCTVDIYARKYAEKIFGKKG